MSNTAFTAAENQLVDFDFASAETQVKSVQANLASATSIADIKSQICSVWSKIGKFVRMAVAVPIVGKYVGLIADLLDSLCKS